MTIPTGRRLPFEKGEIVFELRRSKPMTAAKIAAVLHLARSTVARLLRRHGVDCAWLARIGRPGHRIHGDRSART